MESFKEFNRELSIAIPGDLNKEITDHLIREDGQEDLLFGFWIPSSGSKRDTALINSVLFPQKNDRKIHGNVSFRTKYFLRACQVALKSGYGLAFFHSHPYKGWQGMSFDDLIAEKSMSPSVETITGLPLIGLTVGSDGTWSARKWCFDGKSNYLRVWAKTVRVIGKEFNIFFDDNQKLKFSNNAYLKRTISVWGKENQSTLMNLKIGVVGLGSVGSIVCEILARIGIQNFVLIDFDKIKKHNLDRSLGTSKKDIGNYKVDVISKNIQQSTPLQQIEITIIKKNIAEREAYLAALDCDIIFCCADKPRARYILNHIAYSHLIPVINGGILAEVNKKSLVFADWELSIVGPGKPCMQCLDAFKSSDVILEIEGKLEDPEYIKGLSKNNLYLQNQNVMPFSMNLASLEVLQFVAYTTGIANLDFYGLQRYRFNQAVLSHYLDRHCKTNCDFLKTIALGDKYISPI